MEPGSLDFFISYATPDREWATWIAWQLQSAGYTVELDAWHWAAGMNFVLGMSEAIRRARQVIALFSRRYFEPQRFTTEEWTAVIAMAHNDPGRLLPLVIEPMPKDVIPPVLRPLIRVGLHGMSVEQTKEVLLAAVDRDRGQPEGEPRFPGGPPGGPDPAGSAAAEDEAEPVSAAPATPGTCAGVYAAGGTIKSSPVVADDFVIVGSGDGRLHAVARADMAPVWQAPLDGDPVHASPVVNGSQVYVGARDGVHVLRLDSGAAVGTFLAEPVGSRPLVRDDTVYTVTDAGRVIAVPRSRPAQQHWQWDHDGTAPAAARESVPLSSPCLADGTLYVGTPYGELCAIDAATGVARWSTRIGDCVSSSPAVAHAVVYVGSDDRQVRALSAADGRTLWTHETGGPVYSSPALCGPLVYIGSNDGSLYALDAQTGVRRWAFPTRRGILGTPLVDAGTVYVASYDGCLYAIEAGTGRCKWRFATGGALLSSPALANGLVYVGSLDRHLYAVHA